jgi:p-aminobenzoyl-glutamate transporter AbgT
MSLIAKVSDPLAGLLATAAGTSIGVVANGYQFDPWVLFASVLCAMINVLRAVGKEMPIVDMLVSGLLAIFLGMFAAPVFAPYLENILPEGTEALGPPGLAGLVALIAVPKLKKWLDKLDKGDDQ